MADLEELALRRDRGYLVRLVAMLVIGASVSIYIWRGMTGENTGSCLANAFLGQPAPDAAPAKTP